MKHEYELRVSKRAKRISLTLYPDGRLVATIPTFATYKAAERLIQHKSEWIKRGLKTLEKSPKIILPSPKKKELKKLREGARKLVYIRLKHLSQLEDFKYNKVFIKDLKTQWGSCSRLKNLNFNFRLIFLPEELRDYVILHELCHLHELNHSKKFWSLVYKNCPTYKTFEKDLKNYAIS